jgi:hypothetical protein
VAAANSPVVILTTRARETLLELALVASPNCSAAILTTRAKETRTETLPEELESCHNCLVETIAHHVTGTKGRKPLAVL